MKVGILLWYSLSLLVCQALKFGNRDLSSIDSDPYIYFIDTTIASPKEFVKQKEKVFCDVILPQFASMDAVTWLTFHLHVALHLSELYNLGLYQDISKGRVCVHGEEQLVRVSFPESPFLVHDQGTISLPQTLGLESNHRILHPFDDLAKFARPDLPMTIPSWRFLEKRSIVNAIFRVSPLKFLSSFSYTAQQRLLVPFHPIYMVQDIYLVIMELSQTKLPDSVLTRIRDQTLLSNQYLQSSIVWPYITPKVNSYPNGLPSLPKTVFQFARSLLLPLEFSSHQIPIMDVTLAPPSSSKEVSASFLVTTKQPKLGKEAPSSTEDVPDSPFPTTEKPSEDKEVALPIKITAKSPLLRSTPLRVYESKKKVTIGNKKKVLLLQKQKKTQSFHLNRKDTWERVLAKGMIDVSYAKEYFSEHPFFSSFIHNKKTNGQAFLSLRHLIKNICRRYNKVDAPLLNVVCKKSTSSLESLKVFVDQPERYRGLLLSWFSSFLSHRPHRLDSHPNAPSLLKAQLLLLGKASFFHLQNKLRTHNNISFVVLREGPEVDQSTLRSNNYLNRDQKSTKLDCYRWDEDDIATERLVRRSPIRRPLPPRSREDDDFLAHFRNPAEPRIIRNYIPMNMTQMQENRIIQRAEQKSNVKEAMRSNSSDGFIACGILIKAFLHYFAYISMPAAHDQPLPQKLSLQQGEKQFYDGNKKNFSISRVPIMAEISRLYNLPFFSFTKNFPMSTPLSFSCLLFQLDSGYCKEHTNAFIASSSSSSTSLAFLHTATKIYEQALSFSTKYLEIASSVPQSSLVTLSYFHLLSTFLVQFENISLLSNPALFAYFFAAGATGPFEKYDRQTLYSILCDSQAVIYNNTQISMAYTVYDFDVSEEIKPLCKEPNTMEDNQRFFDDCITFAGQIRSIYDTLNVNQKNTFMQHVFLRWIFAVYQEISQERTDFVTHQHELLFLASERGRRHFNEFLHDAALLQTIRKKG